MSETHLRSTDRLGSFTYRSSHSLHLRSLTSSHCRHYSSPLFTLLSSRCEAIGRTSDDNKRDEMWKERGGLEGYVRGITVETEGLVGRWASSQVWRESRNEGVRIMKGRGSSCKKKTWKFCNCLYSSLDLSLRHQYSRSISVSSTVILLPTNHTRESHE